MKPFLLSIAVLLLLTPAAGAQVVINQAALDQLAGIVPNAAPVTAAPSPTRPAPRRAAYRRVLAKRIGKVPRVASGAIAKPAPAKPVAPPVVAQPVVARPQAPVPPKPALPQLAIIKFTANGFDLPGNSAAALKPFCAHAGNIVTIDAYAAPNPSDPSDAARLSMSRAFAIRDALTACGIPAGEIIPRANGAAKTSDPDAAMVSAAP